IRPVFFIRSFMSEGLPDADIELVVAFEIFFFRERRRDVEADGAETGVVTETYTGADGNLVEGRRGFICHTARIDQPDAPECFREARTQFAGGFVQRSAAARVAVGLRADFLIAISAHGSAAACVKPFGRRNIVRGGVPDAPDTDTGG